MKKSNHSIAVKITVYFLVFCIINLSFSCTRYYRSDTYPKVREGFKHIVPSDYLIVHYDDQNWHLEQVVVDKKNKVVKGKFSDLHPAHQNHEYPKFMANKYNIKKESPVNEVHIYIDAYRKDVNGVIEIDFLNIKRLDIYDKNIGANIASYIGKGIVISSLMFILLLIYIILDIIATNF